MEINDLVSVFHEVSGLDEYQAKTSIYYTAATHRIERFKWFPVLAFIGLPGTGKSKALDVIAQICCKPNPITCHSAMTSASIRDRTALRQEKGNGNHRGGRPILQQETTTVVPDQQGR